MNNGMRNELRLIDDNETLKAKLNKLQDDFVEMSLQCGRYENLAGQAIREVERLEKELKATKAMLLLTGGELEEEHAFRMIAVHRLNALNVKNDE